MSVIIFYSAISFSVGLVFGHFMGLKAVTKEIPLIPSVHVIPETPILRRDFSYPPEYNNTIKK